MNCECVIYACTYARYPRARTHTRGHAHKNTHTRAHVHALHAYTRAFTRRHGTYRPVEVLKHNFAHTAARRCFPRAVRAYSRAIKNVGKCGRIFIATMSSARKCPPTLRLHAAQGTRYPRAPCRPRQNYRSFALMLKYLILPISRARANEYPDNRLCPTRYFIACADETPRTHTQGDSEFCVHAAPADGAVDLPLETEAPRNASDFCGARERNEEALANYAFVQLC